MFAKPEIRKSLLAKMLSELLDTRVMVKSSMKAVAKDRVCLRHSFTIWDTVLTETARQALTKLLNARQLALKFLANVRLLSRLTKCRSVT